VWVVCESVRGGLRLVAGGLVAGGWLVLVRGGCAFRAVGGGLRLGFALVLNVVHLLPRSSSQTVAGCRLGGILLDAIGGVERAVWEGCYPASALAPTCGSNGAS
jgi:hypothetical protein